MLKDITIGQHLPGNSALHKMDPRFKIVLTIAYVVMLFVGTNPVGLIISIAFISCLYMMAKIPASMIGRSIRPLVPILIFSGLLNLLFLKGEGPPLFSFWVINISAEGIYSAIVNSTRILCLIAGTSLLTYTTSPIVLTDAIERLLSPLSKLGFPSHELAMIMTIALRFIPTLIEETDKIMNAQKARGAELDSGGIMQRIKALVPVLIPLFISAFRRTDELAMAMECRCYRGGEGRTRLRQLKINKSDVLKLVICVCVFVFVGFSGKMFSVVTSMF